MIDLDYKLWLSKLPLTERKLGFRTKARHYNIFPIDLPQYLHDKHPITDDLKDLVDEAHQFLKICTESDIRELFDHLSPAYRMFLEGEIKTEEERQRFAVYYLSSEIQRSYFSLTDSFDQNLETSEVLKIYPELFERIDKNGLLHIGIDIVLMMVESSTRMTSCTTISYYEEIILLIKEFSDFLGRFMQHYYRTNKYNTFRIAIDHRRIMPKEFYQQLFECDTWYGPPFAVNKLK